MHDEGLKLEPYTHGLVASCALGLAGRDGLLDSGVKSLKADGLMAVEMEYVALLYARSAIGFFSERYSSRTGGRRVVELVFVQGID